MNTLKLSFGGYPDKFREFIYWHITRAGSSWSLSQIIENNGDFEITGTPRELYELGYEWALYQFPPSNNK